MACGAIHRAESTKLPRASTNAGVKARDSLTFAQTAKPENSGATRQVVVDGIKTAAARREAKGKPPGGCRVSWRQMI